jgi:hypothetical protein
MVAAGHPLSRAYALAGYEARGHSAEANASRLARHPAVAGMIARLRGLAPPAEAEDVTEVDSLHQEGQTMTATMVMDEKIGPTDPPPRPGPADAVTASAREALGAAVRLFDYLLEPTVRPPGGHGQVGASGLPELDFVHFATWNVNGLSPHRRGLLLVIEMAREARAQAKAALAQLEHGMQEATRARQLTREGLAQLQGVLRTVVQAHDQAAEALARLDASPAAAAPLIATVVVPHPEEDRMMIATKVMTESIKTADAPPRPGEVDIIGDLQALLVEVGDVLGHVAGDGPIHLAGRAETLRGLVRLAIPQVASVRAEADRASEVQRRLDEVLRRISAAQEELRKARIAAVIPAP